MYRSRKLEIYDRDFKLKELISFDDNTVENKVDYLTLASSTLTIPQMLNVAFGDYVYSDNIQGIVSCVDYVDGQTNIVYLPMLSMLNVNTFHDRGLLGNSLIGFFVDMIKNEFVQNEDTTQNINGLSILTQVGATDYADAALNIVDNVNNIYELAKKAFNKYRLVISVDLEPYDKQIKITLKINENIRYIHAKKPYVINCEIFVKPVNNGTNKLIGIWKEHEKDSASPYIIKKDENQIISRPTTEYFEGETAADFRQNVKNKSYELFAYDETSNYISVVINSDSNLYAGFEIGDLATIKHKNVEYSAMLSQITKNAGFTTYIFGNIRLNLTDKLLLGGL